MHIWQVSMPLIVTIALAIPGCQTGGQEANGSGSAGQARIRVAAAADGLPAFNVCDRNESILGPVFFGEISDYVPVRSGRHSFTAVNTNGSCSDPDTAGAELILDSNTDFTIVVLFAKEHALDLEDDNSPVPAGMFRIRMINGSPDSGMLDVDAGGDSPVVLSISYNSPADYGYHVLSAGTYDFTITSRSVEMEPFVLSEQELLEGRVYTLFATGRVNPLPGDIPFDVLLSEDAHPGIEQ